jgi:NO-binding membrane sensor protein with MHYT domain
VWFFRSLAGKSTVKTIDDFPEVLFFSLMVCATTVADLRGLEKAAKWNKTFLVLESALLLGAVGSAILYGGLRFAGIINPEVSFRESLLTYSIVITVLLFVLSLTSEILISLVDVTDGKAE